MTDAAMAAQRRIDWWQREHGIEQQHIRMTPILETTGIVSGKAQAVRLF